VIVGLRSHALDRHPIEIDRDTFVKRTLAMELVELDEQQQAFREKALNAYAVLDRIASSIKPDEPNDLDSRN
jgi:hypothetical protein